MVVNVAGAAIVTVLPLLFVNPFLNSIEPAPTVNAPVLLIVTAPIKVFAPALLKARFPVTEVAPVTCKVKSAPVVNTVPVPIVSVPAMFVILAEVVTFDVPDNARLPLRDVTVAGKEMVLTPVPLNPKCQ